jgi:hypothetical protein
MTSSPASRPAAVTPDPSRWVLLSVVLDGALVVLFTVIGRLSHGEDVGIGGVATTAWPFLTGTALAWLAFALWRRPVALLRAGLPVWLLTVVVGMLLRVVSAQGIQFSFVVVATIVLGVFLLGWRAIVAPIARRHARRTAVPRASAG